jgi:uncharacterized protein YqeY
MLLEQITADIKTALKAKESERTNTLRFLIAQINNRQIEKRTKDGNVPLGEDDVIDVLRREVKKRREAADLYRTSGHTATAESEERELAIIQTYLPATPTEAEIRGVIAELKAKGITEFPRLMKEAMPRLKGADGNLVSKVIKEG